MSFNLTTFCLEIINFLVLMWLLQRFLYKPVLKAIANRQKTIENEMNDANEKLKEAQLLKEQYTLRLKEWDGEKSALRETLRSEMQEERERQLVKIREESDTERKRASSLVERQLLEDRQKLEQAALALATQFTTKILSQMASPELESRICKLFLSDLAKTGHGGRDLEAKPASQTEPIEILTAYPLPEVEQSKIKKALGEFVSGPCTCHFSQEPALIAGIRVTFAGMVLQANLQDAVTFLEKVERNGNHS